MEKKIPNVTNSVKKPKLTELEYKIPDVSSLATKTALTAVENKISDVSSLIKKNLWRKNQFMTQKSMNLKKNLLITIMANTLLFQSLIL